MTFLVIYIIYFSYDIARETIYDPSWSVCSFWSLLLAVSYIFLGLHFALKGKAFGRGLKIAMTITRCILMFTCRVFFAVGLSIYGELEFTFEVIYSYFINAFCDAFVDVPAGTYHIRMYKTHVNSLVGFAEISVTVAEQEELLLQYLMPMSINLPGRILVSRYFPAHAEELIASINAGYYRDQQVKQKLKSESERSNRAWATWIIVLCAVIPTLSFLCWLSYDLWLLT